MLCMAETLLPWAVRPATRPEVGGGHVARCSALAVALKRHSAVFAVIESGGEIWQDRFDAAGVQTLPDNGLGDRLFAGVVLDDYAFGSKEVLRWRKCTTGLVVQIEDFGTPLPGIDMAVNATPGMAGDRLAGVPALLGAEFAMLATPYTKRPRVRIRPRIERVVVGIGWVDRYSVTERVLSALARVFGPETRVDILLGTNSPNVKHVAALVNARSEWFLHPDEAEPWRLLEDADMAVSGAGQGLLERLAFGIPTLAISVATNQEPSLTGAASVGAVVDLGGLAAASEEKIARYVASLATDFERRRAISVAAQTLVDGNGASRVASRICEYRHQ